MPQDYEIIWSGKSPLTESLDRDYAAMRGEGWDLWWEPASQMTTDWSAIETWGRPDPNVFVATDINRPRKRPRRFLASEIQETPRPI